MTHNERSASRHFIAVLIAAWSWQVAGCISMPGHASREPVAEINAVLTRQDAAWNAGDIEGFMDGYWRSPELTFVSGGTVTQGWDATLERYRKRYPDRAAMGKLTFSDLHIEDLGKDTALVRGQWHLDRAEPIGGMFTLIFRRIDGRWLIVYDHTSVAEK